MRTLLFLLLVIAFAALVSANHLTAYRGSYQFPALGSNPLHKEYIHVILESSTTEETLRLEISNTRASAQYQYVVLIVDSADATVNTTDLNDISPFDVYPHQVTLYQEDEAFPSFLRKELKMYDDEVHLLEEGKGNVVFYPTLELARSGRADPRIVRVPMRIDPAPKCNEKNIKKCWGELRCMWDQKEKECTARPVILFPSEDKKIQRREKN